MNHAKFKIGIICLVILLLKLRKIRNFNLIHEIYFKNKNKYNDNTPKVVKIPFHFMLFSNNNSLDAILTNQ